MFSDRAKEWIKENVEDVYTGNTDNAIRTFEYVTEIISDDKSFRGINDKLPLIIEKMSDEISRKELELDLIDFSKIEAFIHYVLYITDPQKEASEKWTLSPLLTDGLGIVPPSFNLATGNPKNINFRYKDSYMRIYALRNADSHFFHTLSLKDIFAAITDLCVVYLDVSSRFTQEITAEYRKRVAASSFDIGSYIKGIKDSHKKKVESGYGFVDLEWNDGAKGVKSAELLKKSDVVRILGEAGCGKTTLMEEMVWQCAANFDTDRGTPLPVYYELKNLSDTSFTIEDILAEGLGISKDSFGKVAKGLKLAVFLDGFNEILNTDIKSKFALSIESYIRKNSRYQFFVSDRSVVRSDILLLRDSRKVLLSPLTVEQKKEFFKKNAGDPEVRKMLMDKLDSDPGYFSSLRTPLQLKQLIEVTGFNKAVPGDFVGEYLESLITREQSEKKDVNAHYLKDFLEITAMYMTDRDEKSVPEIELKMVLRDTRDKIGYENCDTDTVLRLMIDMGLLAKEQSNIVFLNEEYLDYFWVEGGSRGIEKLLGR